MVGVNDISVNFKFIIYTKETSRGCDRNLYVRMFYAVQSSEFTRKRI
jgi:hypothetical protein